MWSIQRFLRGAVVTLLAWSAAVTAEEGPDYLAAKWNPIHFQPQIQTATNEQCLACHQNLLEDPVLAESPAGVKAQDSLAWYQTLSVYEGPQETFHRRHMVTPLAQQLMEMKCNTCHQGSNPREQAPIPPDPANKDFTLRKSVNPETCLMCHGKFPYTNMNLPSEWHTSSAMFGDNCLLCHAAIRTTRHQVNYLKAAAIEEAGKANSDSCYGCHGGRAWYRIAFPYARHPWPGMPEAVPEWAKDRPTSSPARFLIGAEQAAGAANP